jgi:hypothetical protein
MPAFRAQPRQKDPAMLHANKHRPGPKNDDPPEARQGTNEGEGARAGEGEGDVCERPEVKPLVEKAGVKSLRSAPPGSMVTGGDTPGGGAAKPLDLDTPHKPGAGAPAKDKGDRA